MMFWKKMLLNYTGAKDGFGGGGHWKQTTTDTNQATSTITATTTKQKKNKQTNKQTNKKNKQIYNDEVASSYVQVSEFFHH